MNRLPQSFNNYKTDQFYKKEGTLFFIDVSSFFAIIFLSGVEEASFYIYYIDDQKKLF